METIRKKIALFLDRYSKYCWASLVSFWMHNNWNEIKNPSGESCRKESETETASKCEKIAHGKNFAKQSKQEQERLRSI